MTALHWAALRGHGETLRSLLEKLELYHWINKTGEDFEVPPWNQNGYIPSIIIPYHKRTITVIRGKYSEVSVSFQVLCSEHLAWKPKKPYDDIPETAVVASTSSKGEKLYIGRTYVSYSGKEVMTPGKVSGTDRILIMPFYSNDSMVTDKNYEILVVSY
ncbi:unnamed protein product [Nezara viridula]|uniref:Uncharacterized protein n=1 Tax=Nezara viridula TaxID=85310 RepID=A0A9P0H6Y1_NEZVI|nr:unnamed protein product [Nezara viridula]